ncbi:hypothetical protein TNCV_5096071 [Trichonephila clavipes]|nr:hypothetical protein TNCV_5096071 [Trichonephila clavipes]
MSSPGFEPRPYGTAVSFANFYTGWATRSTANNANRDLELEVNENDIEELIMGHEDELTIEELQEILNEEH